MSVSHTLSLYTVLLFAHLFFFFNAPATTEIYTLSLHDALPIYWRHRYAGRANLAWRSAGGRLEVGLGVGVSRARTRSASRSEEHTSELQSHSDLVCRLLLEKKKTNLQQDDMLHENEACETQRHI